MNIMVPRQPSSSRRLSSAMGDGSSLFGSASRAALICPQILAGPFARMQRATKGSMGFSGNVFAVAAALAGIFTRQL